MCDRGQAAGGAGAAGAAAQVYTGFLNKDLADQQADVQRGQALNAIHRGDEAAGRVDRRVAQVLGRQRAAIGANNVSLATGSAAQVQSDVAELGALDAALIRFNARRAARGYRAQADITEFTGRLARLSGIADGLTSASQSYADGAFDPFLGEQ